MINTQKTGAYISQLRKGQNLTQADMAARLTVSPQAVSKWETGQALPDAEQLVGLSKLFCVSINAILAGEDPREVASPELEGSPTPESALNNGGGAPDTAAVVRLAPFVERHLLCDMVVRCGLHAFTQEEMEGLAPFVGSDLLNQYVDQLAEVDARHLDGLAPFVRPQNLERLVERIGSPLTVRQLIGLAPFLSSQRLGELFEQRAKGTDADDEEPDFEVLVALAPFLPTRVLSAALEIHPPRSFDELQAVAPFVDRAVVNLLTRRLMGVQS